MSGAIWTRDEVQALIALIRKGMSGPAIAAALTDSTGRTITSDAIRKRMQRLRAQGVDLPSLGGQGSRPAAKRQSPERVVAPVLKQPKRNHLAGPQTQAMRAVIANSRYEPAAIIAGFPTIQIRKDREGNALAPVTLRRIDFGGAHA